MPVEYSGINDEHITVREKVGVFDVSHMGEFWIKGPKAAGFLQYITTNDINSLYDGKVHYSCMPNGRGGIKDDLLVYRVDPETYMIVVNAANIEKDWDWCCYHAPKFGLEVGTELCNASDEFALLAVQGPYAFKVMQKLIDVPIDKMKFYTFKKLDIGGVKNAIFSTTGYTGSGGYEIYVNNDDGPALWKSVFEAGEEFGIKPAGLGARDTLRLETGLCLYGNDIDETTSPIEAGLQWIVKFTDNNEFIDREFLLKQKMEGPERRLVGFVMHERGIPRTNYEITDEEGSIIGHVTSGTMSPMMKTGIGLGYVRSAYAKNGTGIKILVRNKSISAEVAGLPLFKKQ